MFCNCRVIGRSLASSREELGEASDSGRKMVVAKFLMITMTMMIMFMMIMTMVMTVTQLGRWWHSTVLYFFVSGI